MSSVFLLFAKKKERLNFESLFYIFDEYQININNLRLDYQNRYY